MVSTTTPTTQPLAPYGAAGNTGTPPNTTTTTAPPTAAAKAVTPTSTGGSFPTSPSGQGLGVNGVPVAKISVAQFLSNYDISSTEEDTYISDNNGTMALNQNALMLMQYQSLPQDERQDVQQSLVNAGLLPDTDATGIMNSSATSAFKEAIANATNAGTDVNTYLQQYSGTNYSENLLSSATAAAQKEATTPTTVTEENATTLTQDISSAFGQALGYSPSEAQINQFISQIQGQDTANAMAPHQEAEQQLQMLKSDQSALSKMGPDDIDSIISAYTSAIHGVNPTAGSSQAPQGPTMGQLAPTPGSPAVPGKTVQQPVMGQVKVGGLSAAGHDVGAVLNTLNPFASPQSKTWETGNTTTTRQVGTKPVQLPGTAATPATPGGPSRGGVYALNSADWKQAQNLFSGAKKYASAGQAPASVQQAAFTALLQNLYDNNGGSWADAIVSLGGGNPNQTSAEGVLGSKTNLQSFATNIANDVNNQLEHLNSQIQTQSVTTKVPDVSSEAIAAEAAAYAKSSDPAQYYASNAASFGDVLNGMLSGKSNYYQESGSDYFTGPVNGPGTSELAAGAATTPAASAPSTSPAAR